MLNLCSRLCKVPIVARCFAAEVITAIDGKGLGCSRKFAGYLVLAKYVPDLRQLCDHDVQLPLYYKGLLLVAAADLLWQMQTLNSRITLLQDGRMSHALPSFGRLTSRWQMRIDQAADTHYTGHS